MGSRESKVADQCHKVVVHLENEVLKGVLQGYQGHNLDDFLRKQAVAQMPVLRISSLTDDTIREIDIQSTKAVFFVKDFDGDVQHKNLRFYRGAPIMHDVWLRVEFADGEVMEGLVHNTARFLLEPGFLMFPTDPYSNNQFVYVVKSWVKECNVLGLRNTCNAGLPGICDSESASGPERG
jgi:hypothetical protein